MLGFSVFLWWHRNKENEASGVRHTFLSTYMIARFRDVLTFRRYKGAFGGKTSVLPVAAAITKMTSMHILMLFQPPLSGANVIYFVSSFGKGTKTKINENNCWTATSEIDKKDRPFGDLPAQKMAIGNLNLGFLVDHSSRQGNLHLCHIQSEPETLL